MITVEKFGYVDLIIWKVKYFELNIFEYKICFNLFAANFLPQMKMHPNLELHLMQTWNMGSYFVCNLSVFMR